MRKCFENHRGLGLTRQKGPFPGKREGHGCGAPVGHWAGGGGGGAQRPLCLTPPVLKPPTCHGPTPCLPPQKPTSAFKMGPLGRVGRGLPRSSWALIQPESPIRIPGPPPAGPGPQLLGVGVWRGRGKACVGSRQCPHVPRPGLLWISEQLEGLGVVCRRSAGRGKRAHGHQLSRPTEEAGLRVCALACTQCCRCI